MTDSRARSRNRRILVIKLGALGDVLLATSLLRSIQAAHPDEHCTLLTTPAYATLFRRWPALEVVAIERHGAGNFLRMLALARSGFDRVYDLQSNDRSRLLCALSGIPERVGNHPRFPYTLHPRDPWRGDRHIFERMNDVLAAAGVAPAPERGWLPPDPDAEAAVGQWLEAAGLTVGSYALVHAGASPGRPEKRWPGFPDLVRALVGEGVSVVAVGAGAAREVNRELAAAGAHDATDAFDIAGLAALAKRARFALTNDSGPMHVIATAGIPVYAFFGPSDWRRNHALGQAERVFAAPRLADITMEAVRARLVQDGFLAPASRS